MLVTTDKKHTVKEFLQMDFEGEDAYYELINGEIVKKAAPTPRHQYTTGRLFSKMLNHAIENKLGEVFTSPIDVFLDEYNQVQPDILFNSNKNLGILDYKDGILGVPDLIVEIISPGSYAIDRFDKKGAYEKAGVKEYWLVDPNNHSVEVYSLKKHKYELSQVAAEEGNIQSGVLAGLEVDVNAIFPND
jgi:Uma2 family endonuclease